MLMLMLTLVFLRLFSLLIRQHPDSFYPLPLSEKVGSPCTPSHSPPKIPSPPASPAHTSTFDSIFSIAILYLSIGCQHHKKKCHGEQTGTANSTTPSPAFYNILPLPPEQLQRYSRCCTIVCVSERESVEASITSTSSTSPTSCLLPLPILSPPTLDPARKNLHRPSLPPCDVDFLPICSILTLRATAAHRKKTLMCAIVQL